MDWLHMIALPRSEQWIGYIW